MSCWRGLYELRLFPVSHSVISCLPWSGLGGSQRLGGCHPFHYECVAGLPHLLADFQYHGGQLVCGQVLLLFQSDIRGILFSWQGQQQDRVWGPHAPKLYGGQVEERQDQLWQCGRRLPGPAASGESVAPSLLSFHFLFHTNLVSFLIFLCTLLFSSMCQLRVCCCFKLHFLSQYSEAVYCSYSLCIFGVSPCPFLHLLVSFHAQAVPQEMHQFRFEFEFLWFQFRRFLVFYLFLVSTNVFNHVSLLKGHIQRLDGHYVRSCGFKRGIFIAPSINILSHIYLTAC